MKRTAALVILAALLLQTLSITGCAERELRRTGDDFLSDAGKAFYDYADSVYNGSAPAVFGEDCGLNAFEMSEIVDIYSDDHPEVFWIDERYNLSGEKGRYELRACVGGAELDEMKRELEAAVSSVLSGIGPRASDYEKELYIHDFLADSVEYTEELYEPVGDDGSYPAGSRKRPTARWWRAAPTATASQGRSTCCAKGRACSPRSFRAIRCRGTATAGTPCSSAKTGITWT